jgi:predicted DNA-binding ribbon-helix-helix protein
MPSRNVPDRHHSEAVYRALDEFSGRLVSRHIRISDRRTNIRLTGHTWRLLREIAERKRITVDELCTEISSRKPASTPLSVAVRAAALRYYLAGE